MRSLFTALGIFLIMVAFIITSVFYVNASTRELTDSIDLVINAVEDENWQLAHSIFLKTKENLEKKSEKFEAIYDHEEIDQLKISQVRAESYIKENWQDNALCELAQLKMLINHLSEKDKLSFYNIF